MKIDRNAKVAVLGLGISNIALIEYLRGIGVYNIYVYDRKHSARAEELIKKGIVKYFTSGNDYLINLSGEKFDYIFKSPVIRPDVPEIAAAVRGGAVLTSEMEYFMMNCPCKIYAVTGSDGKTTTTTLTYLLLKNHYEGTDVSVWLGGNIGTPLIDKLGLIKPDDRVVLELSSFQLMTMHVSANASVITNITPNHLDVHKNYEEYIEAKRNVYSARPDARVVLNAGNDVTLETAEKLISEGREVDLFSAHIPSDSYPASSGEISFLDGTDLVWCGHRFDTRTMLLPGLHNVENLMAAALLARDEIDFVDLCRVGTTFGGVEHRLELVRTLNGVKYYNSSIDSSPNRTINALSVFSQKVILIAGGKDKGIPYDALGPVLKDKVKCAILTGPTAALIDKALKSTEEGSKVPVHHVKSYEEAVSAAYSAAKPGDIVLLSPASTSFDMFKNFEERGRKFKELVNRL